MSFAGKQEVVIFDMGVGQRFFAYRLDRRNRPLDAKDFSWFEVSLTEGNGCVTAIQLPKSSSSERLSFDQTGVSKDYAAPRKVILTLDGTKPTDWIERPTQRESELAIQRYLSAVTQKLDEDVATARDVATALVTAQAACLMFKSVCPDYSAEVDEINHLIIRAFRSDDPQSCVGSIKAVSSYIRYHFAGVYSPNNAQLSCLGCKAVADLGSALSLIERGRQAYRGLLPIQPHSTDIGEQLLKVSADDEIALAAPNPTSQSLSLAR